MHAFDGIRQTAYGFCTCLAVVAACAAPAPPRPQALRELTPLGLEPPPGALAGPLDQWGDWLRGAPHWQLDRKIIDSGPESARRAVRTEARPRTPQDAALANRRGWFVTGFRVDGSEWAEARGVRFFCRTDRPGRVRMILYTTESVWHLDRVAAETTLATRSTWTEMRLNLSAFHTAKSAPPDWRRVRAVGWVIEGKPNAIEIAGFRVLLPDSAYRRVIAARLERRLKQLRLDARSLAGRDLPLPSLAEFAKQVESRLKSAVPPADAALENAADLLACAERVRSAGDTLFSIRQRLAHYQDYLAAAPDDDSTRALQREAAALERRRQELACELRAAQDVPVESVAAVAALEHDTDRLWDRVRALTRAAPGRFRPSTDGIWWRRPGGRRIVPLAAHVLHTIYRHEKGWRQPRDADYRLLSTWGFNATRVEVRYAALEPQQGTFDPAYLGMIQNVIEWADKYGLYAVIDIHWPYPDWFYRGPKDRPCPHREEQNPYHQPDALVSTCRRLARALANHPNILAWEAPTNEPAVSSIEIWPKPEEDATIADIPALMHSWNQWLHRKYGTRENLDRVWRDTLHLPDKNGLGPDESWTTDSILPPGKRGVPARWNRRLYDYLEWAVETHTDLCARIAEAVRESIPGLVIQQQPIAGGARWERDPIPVNFRAWQQLHRPGVQVGTHYGVGHACAWISPLGMPSMNSEERTEWRKGIFARQRARNQGATAFVYFPFNGFITPSFRLKDSTAWLAAVSEFWDHAECRFPRPVLVIVNSRLAAIGSGQDGSAVVSMLERLGIGYDVAASAYVARNVEILRRYRAVTLSLDYADPACIAAVRAAGVPAWMFGRPVPDIRAGFGRNSIPARLARSRFFLKTAPTAKSSGQTETVPDFIDLTGIWRFRTDPRDVGLRLDWQRRDADDRDWEEQAVPAYWENIGVLHKQRNYEGVAWYRRRVRIPHGWAGRSVILEFGGIDDLDETFVNGRRVGGTGRDVPHYWEAFRRYRVPPGLLRPGGDNVIAVRVVDLRGNGGIWRPPVRLRLAEPGRVRFRRAFGRGLFRAGSTLESRVSANMPAITRDMLSRNSRVFAEFATSGQAPRVALVRSGQSWLWLGSDTVDPGDPNALKLLAAFLREAGLAPPWPPPESRDGVSVYRFEPDWIAVVNESRQTRRVTLPVDSLVTDVEGGPLEQTVLPSGGVQVRVPGEHPSSALFLRVRAVGIKPGGPVPIQVREFTEIRLPGRVETRLETQSSGPAVLLTPPMPAGGTVETDGKKRSVPSCGGLRLPLPRGAHLVRITRTSISNGYFP